MTDHTSKDYDEALQRARQLVALMGARVERQLDDAIDELAGQIIARRQPAARDLRLLMALLSATTDLERVGDESKKIALYARSIFSSGRPVLPRVVELRPMAALVRDMLRRATRAIETLDPSVAAALVRRDLDANASFRTVLAQLAGFMVEDPRTISACLDILFVAKSLERIGDHAKNVAEHAVYAAMGKDVRHATAQEIEQALRT